MTQLAIAEEVDLQSIAPGTIVDEVFGTEGTGPIHVKGTNPSFPGMNAAMIFDSANPTGQDPDLGTPNQAFGGPGIGAGGAAGEFANMEALGHILIVSEDLDSNDPDDADLIGSSIEFDFSSLRRGRRGQVTLNAVKVLDVEAEELGPGVFVEASGPRIPTSMFTIPAMGDNGVAEIDLLGLEGVSRLKININGSAGVADIRFNADERSACWITTGGFQNAGLQSGSKMFSFGGNVGPPPSGAWEVIDHTTGDNFHSNDVHIVDCLASGTTGPGQPGGKKGFVIDKALFAGTGKLNHVDGYPFEGFVIDAGEPAGKKSNDSDYFEIIVRDPVTNDVVFMASGNLDGGNVQIHPPTGSTN